MIGVRRHVSGHQLLGVVRAAFGKRWLESVRRLGGGARKGVYRLTLDNGRAAIAYVWHPAENYWPDATGPLGDACGLDLFTSAHEALTAAGVRVPEIVMVDRTGTFVEGDVAVVEDVPGGSLEVVEPGRAEPVLRRLARTVRAMHGHVAESYGRIGAPCAGAVADLVLGRALDQLAEAAARVDRIAAVRDRLTDLLRARHAAVAPRTGHRLVHGDLGPDHVLLTDDDEPVLIDIESTMHFDVEWEHAFLELRFGADYHHFATPDLDVDRMRLYRLALSLSLVAGPLRLLDGDHPTTTAMDRIVTDNVERTLSQLAESDVDRPEFAE